MQNAYPSKLSKISERTKPVTRKCHWSIYLIEYVQAAPTIIGIWVMPITGSGAEVERFELSKAMNLAAFPRRCNKPLCDTSV